MGFIDAFVYAHHQQSRSIENPRNFGDCMKGRIRFITAITPAYVHAYLVTCLTRHMPAVPCLNFRLPKPKARYPHLPNIRTTSRERGNDFQGWAICTDGCIRLANGETLAGWGAIARSHHGRTDVMFGPASARIHHCTANIQSFCCTLRDRDVGLFTQMVVLALLMVKLFLECLVLSSV